MSRKNRAPKREVLADPLYNSKLVTRLINRVMLDGKRGTAASIVYGAFEQIKEATGNDALEVFETAMENIMPGGGKQNAILTFDWSNVTEEKGEVPTIPGGTLLTGGNNSLNPNGKRLARTGLESTSSVFAGIITLAGAVFLGRKRQK